MPPLAPGRLVPKLPLDGIEGVLHVLHARTGVDLRAHRAATIERRLSQRLSLTGDGTLARYLDRLASDPAEPDLLVAQLTVKVSSFFRDAALYDALAGEVVPDLAQGRTELAAWSAGAARGEEAYSLGMLLALAGRPWRVLGTDVDVHALAAAEQGAYPLASADAVPPPMRARFLATDGAKALVAPELRHRTTFRRHDLTGEAGLCGERFDLVLCRNVLIYFASDVQERVLAMLLEHLSPGGYLCLGHAEWPPPRAAARLAVVHRRTRVFRHAPSSPHGSQQP